MGAKICPLKSHQDCGLWGLFFMIIERTWGQGNDDNRLMDNRLVNNGLMNNKQGDNR